MSNITELFTTYDSSHLDESVKSAAALVEARFTVTLDLFPEIAPGNRTKWRWFNKGRISVTGEVGVGGWNDTDTTSLPVTADSASLLNVGDELKVESEVVVVKAVDRTGNTIDVFERGASDTTGAAHVATTQIDVIGSAHVESTVDGDGMVEDDTELFNYMQLFQEPIEMSKTARNQDYENTDDQLADHREKAMVRLLKKANRSVLFGRRDAGSKVKPRMMGGISYLIENTTGGINTNVGGALTETDLIDMLWEISNAGGAPNVLLVSPTEKKTINTFNNSYVETLRTDKGAGIVINFYEHDVGSLAIISDPLMNGFGELFALNTNKMAKRWFQDDALRFAPEPANSRTIRETLQGQMSIALQDSDTDFGRLYGIT